MSGPLMGLGDGRRGDAGAVTGAGGQVAGDGEGFRRQGREVHIATPVGEQFPLCAIDAPGVDGEDRLQGGGDALVGGAQGRQGRGWAGDDCQGRRWSWVLRRGDKGRDFSG